MSKKQIYHAEDITETLEVETLKVWDDEQK